VIRPMVRIGEPKARSRKVGFTACLLHNKTALRKSLARALHNPKSSCTITVGPSMDIFGRRDVLRIGSLGALGITLDKVLRANGRKDVSCILVWQSGGCGHMDTFDMKPDAPKEIRGEFKPISTNVPGIQICEHLPYTAKQADKFTILRSMKSRENNHERAINYLLTGYLPLSTIE